MYKIEKMLLLLLLLLPELAWGQAAARRKQQYTNDTLTVKERISFHTNAVDWLLLTPNVGVEFDLSKMDWGRNTIYLYARWNGNTKHSFKPSWVYNIGEVRGEFRHYFRTRVGGKLTVSDTIKPTLKDRWHYLTGLKKRNPRDWRAYYYGGYATYGSYSFKFSGEGKQGAFASVGFTAGFGMPLYSYKHADLDLEIGASIGLVATHYDKYGYDAESDCYPFIPEGSKGWHVKPYPMVTDFHVSFVYRFNGIKRKYKGINYAKIEAKEARDKLRMERRDSIKQVKALEKQQRDALKDSLNMIAKARKDSIMQKFNARGDSLMTKEAKEAMKRMEKQDKEQQKLEKEQRKLEKERLKEQKKAEKAAKKGKAVKEDKKSLKEDEKSLKEDKKSLKKDEKKVKKAKKEKSEKQKAKEAAKEKLKKEKEKKLKEQQEQAERKEDMR